MKCIEWPWPDLENVFRIINIPDGYIPSLPRKDELQILIQKIQKWYPDIVVGQESVHLDENFYIEKAFLADSDGHEKIVLPIIFKHQGEIVALVSFQKDALAYNLTSRVGAIDFEHRGSGLAFVGPALLEEVGRQMGAQLIHYFATLKIPHQQVAAEKMGFTLIGIMPAYSPNEVKPGIVKRVYKAIYAKVLANNEDIEVPLPEAMTPRTKDLFNRIFEDKPAKMRHE